MPMIYQVFNLKKQELSSKLGVRQLKKIETSGLGERLIQRIREQGYMVLDDGKRLDGLPESLIVAGQKEHQGGIVLREVFSTLIESLSIPWYKIGRTYIKRH